ncbi:MAG: alpha/beta hydrolase [Faecalibacterium sp.]
MEMKQLELCGGAHLAVYLRDAVDTMPAALRRPLVLVVPGGGYTHVSAREADPVALQFAAAGYHTAVLTYTVGEGAKDYQPLRQIHEALAQVRAHAEEWHVIPDKVAVCGFSAGGHLALSSAVLDLPGMAAGEQQRPNAVVLGYPVISAGEHAHRGSFEMLAASTDRAAQKVFSLEDKITSAVPPVFVWHTMEDTTVPVENTLLLLNALHKAGVRCEAHLFEKGEHGTSISTAEVGCPSAHRHHWVELALEWLGDTLEFHV